MNQTGSPNWWSNLVHELTEQPGTEANHAEFRARAPALGGILQVRLLLHLRQSKRAGSPLSPFGRAAQKKRDWKPGKKNKKKKKKKQKQKS